MFERFTDRARKVMQLANQEAQRLHHEQLAPEHILIGLAKEGKGVAGRVLAALGVEPASLLEPLRDRLPPGRDVVVMGRLSLTDAADRVVRKAAQQAADLGHSCVGTEHLLLGLTLDTEGPAFALLAQLGVTWPRAIKGLQELRAAWADEARANNPEAGAQLRRLGPRVLEARELPPGSCVLVPKEWDVEWPKIAPADECDRRLAALEDQVRLLWEVLLTSPRLDGIENAVLLCSYRLGVEPLRFLEAPQPAKE